MTRAMEQGMDAPARVLRLPRVQARTGLARSTIYVRVAGGSFPQPMRPGARAVGWIESEVDAWIRNQIAASRSSAAFYSMVSFHWYGTSEKYERAGQQKRPGYAGAYLTVLKWLSEYGLSSDTRGQSRSVVSI